MALPKSDLKKAYIQVLSGKQKNTKIEVLYNPAEYTIEKSNTFQSVAIPGLEAPVQQFVAGNAKTLTMKLFFDTYTRTRGEIEDVRNHTGKIMKLLDIDPELHAPPVCEFIWGEHPQTPGKLAFKAIIERINQNFTLFLDSGTPVRATLDVTFKEYRTVEEQLQDIGKNSADRTKRRIFNEGDALWLFAAEEYGDPARWREIAEENEIDNARIIEPGLEIIIPPLE